MYTIELNWKEFNVDLDSISEMVKNLDENYCGASAHSVLQLHFTAEPSQEVKDEIESHWESLDEESDEAVAYKSAEDRKAEKEADTAAKKASARAKLLTLGLSEEECDAVLGA